MSEIDYIVVETGTPMADIDKAMEREWVLRTELLEKSEGLSLKGVPADMLDAFKMAFAWGFSAGAVFATKQAGEDVNKIIGHMRKMDGQAGGRA